MKFCRKILYLFLVSFISISLLVGCQNNQSSSNSEDTQEKTSNTTEGNSNNASSNNEFKEYDILSFSEIKLDKNPTYDGDDFYRLKVKVTNNSNETIRSISPNFFAYDKNGDMIVSVEGQELGSIESNKSLNIEAIIDKDTNINSVKINNYSYDIGDKYYTVDVVSKYAEVYTK